MDCQLLALFKSHVMVFSQELRDGVDYVKLLSLLDEFRVGRCCLCYIDSV
jgi:hypothetical protein